MKTLFATLLAVALLTGAEVAPGDRSVVVSGAGYFPVLIRLQDGRLMAVLRGGAPHIGRLGRLDIVTSSDDGRTWATPRTVMDGPDDDRNPGLGQLKNGDILLTYAIIHGYDENDRHRGGGHPPTPATPPCVRVRTRRFESVTLTLFEQ